MPRYQVQTVTKAKTKNGKVYLRMTVYESGGKLWNAIFWEDKNLSAGNVIDAFTEESAYNGVPQLEIKAMRILAEKCETDEFLPKAKIDVNALMDDLWHFADSVQDLEIKTILKFVLEDPRWKRAPAGMKVHHARLGGLLEHTTNLCRIVDALVPDIYPDLDRDLLIFAAIMHDAGKLTELSYESNIDYTDEGRLMGHVTMSLLMLENALLNLQQHSPLQTPGQQFRHVLLRHMILSHHGAQAYGSPIVPQLAEAAIFSKLDQLDATMGSIAQAVENAAGKRWTDPRPGQGEALCLRKE